MEPIVTTSSGAVRGLLDEGIACFLGVPYAAAPVGPHRLAPPAPVEPWVGVRDAAAHGPTAPQPEQGFTLIPEPTIPGDDCLNLDVFTPDPGAGGGLPVLVWIHGGGFVTGCNSSPWYRGTRFARDGVVVVAVNYRLGVEGFAAVEGAVPNRGVLDWLAALEWVQREIAAFGGDPGRVTVAGQSAGGVAAVTLLSLPRARGLLHRVIAMSGAAQYGMPYDEALPHTRRLADHLGVAPTRDGLASLPPGQVAQAERDLAAAGPGPAAPMSGSPLGPLVDGDLVPVAPLDAVAGGAGAGCPLLVGTTAEEMNPLYLTQADHIDEARLARRLARRGLGDEAVAAYRELLGPGTPPWRVLAAAVSDQFFRLPAGRLADARDGTTATTFAYEFRWRSPALGGVGAAHCLDLPFAWDLLDAPHVATVLGPEPPQALADRMHRHWVDFVTTGDPGWPAYDRERRATMALDGDACAVVDDPLAPVRAIWRDRATAP